MEKRLFVGGISYELAEADLRAEFEKAGTVDSVKIISDRETGRSKGFGFIDMSTEDEAKAAIEMLNGQELDGRAIKVDEAKPLKQL